MIPQGIGSYVNPVKGDNPNPRAAGTFDGAAIDRAGIGQTYSSAELQAVVGPTTGTPTSFTADLKLQDSADGSTGWADITGAAAPQLVAINSESKVRVNLATVKRFIRVRAVVAFVGGTAPTVVVASTVVLGGAAVEPA